MKKIIIYLLSIILFLNLIIYIPSTFAFDLNSLSPNYSTSPNNKIKGITNKILGYVVATAAITLTILIAYFGLKIQYGSIEERAEYKKQFIPLVVGVTIVLSASTITSMVWKLSNENETVSITGDVIECNGKSYQISIYGDCKAGFDHQPKVINKNNPPTVKCSKCGKSYKVIEIIGM